MGLQMLKVTIPTKQYFLLIALLCYLLSIGNNPISICTKMCVKYLHEFFDNQYVYTNAVSLCLRRYQNSVI